MEQYISFLLKRAEQIKQQLKQLNENYRNLITEAQTLCEHPVDKRLETLQNPNRDPLEAASYQVVCSVCGKALFQYNKNNKW